MYPVLSATAMTPLESSKLNMWLAFKHWSYAGRARLFFNKFLHSCSTSSKFFNNALTLAFSKLYEENSFSA